MLILYWVDKVSSIVKTVNFDAVTSETHDNAMALTSHPVEDGVDVTDHARPEQRKLSVEGFVSNKPLWSNLLANPLNVNDQVKLLSYQAKQLDIPKKQGGAPIFTPGGLVAAATSAIGSLLHGPPPSTAFVLTSGGDFPDRAVAVYDLLEEARTKAALISAITIFGTISNLLISKVSIPRKPDDGNGAVFVVDMTQVRIVKSETVNAPSPAEARGKKEIAKGSKNVKKAEAKGKAQMVSVLAGAEDGVGSLVKPLTGVP